MRLKKDVLGTGLFVLLVIVSSCQSGDIVNAVKKGRLQQAPNITVDELVKRYQFIDASSVKWDKSADSNNNEYAQMSASFEELGIVFNSLQNYIWSGAADITVLMHDRHEFFLGLVTPEGFKNSSLPFMNVRAYSREPDYGNPGAPDYFECTGGTVRIYFTADNKVAKIESALLNFQMQSVIDGELENYELEYSVSIEDAQRMLLDNTDLGYGSP